MVCGDVTMRLEDCYFMVTYGLRMKLCCSRVFDIKFVTRQWAQFLSMCLPRQFVNVGHLMPHVANHFSILMKTTSFPIISFIVSWSVTDERTFWPLRPVNPSATSLVSCRQTSHRLYELPNSIPLQRRFNRYGAVVSFLSFNVL